jgi:GntR family transcriptional repressor for pyruvate dehydrogenase complex
MTQPARPRRPARAHREVADLHGISPVAVTRLADEVAEQIRRFIITESVSEGARLPSERDLAQRFGASRPTVSQALRTLSLMGLVEVRRGSGAYVVRRPESMVKASVNLMLDLDEPSVDDLMQLRLWLETLAVEHAARRALSLGAADADAVQEALRGVAGSTDNASQWIADDTVFHASVVRSAGNPYLTALYEAIHTAILSYEYRHWVDSGRVPAWLQKTSKARQPDLHGPIARAVLAGDVIAARAAVVAHHSAMSRHLDAARASGKRGRRR